MDPKAGDAELLKQFGEIVADYDPDRVYISDIRKMVSWYNLLLANELLDFTEEIENTGGTEEKTEDTEEKVPEKPKKKTPAKPKSSGE